MNASDQHLPSALALLKALKSPSDPPEPNHPNRITIARQAWLSPQLFLPRKAEVLRDWILDSWQQKHEYGAVPLFDIAYYQLFLELCEDSPDMARISPSVLSDFFEYASVDTQLEELIPVATKTFQLLFQSRDHPLKSELWVDVWIKMIGFLSRFEATASAQCYLDLIRLVHGELRLSLRGSILEKKSVQLVHMTLPLVAQAFHRCPGAFVMSDHLLATILFPTSVLSTANPIQALLGSLKPDDRPTIVPFLHRVLALFIIALRQNQHELFTYASSSKSPYDLSVSNRIRERLRIVLDAILSYIDQYEQRSMKTSLQANWETREAVWIVIRNSGYYLETELSWGQMVERVSSQAQQHLVRLQATGEPDEQPLATRASPIISLLTVLEGLDHTRTNINVDTVACCLANVNVERGVARNLLLALLRYHRLSHSVAIFCTQLDDGLRVLLPSTLTGEAIVRRYQQIDRGVLADSQLRKALATAMRSAISSKQIGTASDSIATQLVAEMQSTLSHLEIPLPVPGVAENPRKRRAKSPNCYCNASGAVFALQTRLLVLAIDAQRGAAPGDCDISKLLKLAIRYCRDGAKLWERDIEAVSLLPTDGTKTPSQMSKPEGDAHDILVAATLRLIRATAIGLSGDRSMITFSEEEYIRYLGSSTTSLQVKLELFGVLFKNGHSSSEHPSRDYLDRFIACLLDELDLDTPGRFEAGAEVSLELDGRLAVWAIVTDQGVDFLEKRATVSQMTRFCELLVARSANSSHRLGRPEIAKSNPILRIICLPSTWEKPKFRGAFIAVLQTYATGTQEAKDAVVALLPFIPISTLDRVSQDTLVTLACNARRIESDRPLQLWLAQAVTDSDLNMALALKVKVLERLLHTEDGREYGLDAEATLTLLKAIYTRDSQLFRSSAKGNAGLPGPHDSPVELVLRELSRWISVYCSAAYTSVWQSKIYLLVLEVLMLSGSQERFGIPMRSRFMTLHGELENCLTEGYLSRQRRLDWAMVLGWAKLLEFGRWLNIDVTTIALGSSLRTVDPGQRDTPSQYWVEVAASALNIAAHETIASSNLEPQVLVLELYFRFSSTLPTVHLDGSFAKACKIFPPSSLATILATTINLLGIHVYSEQTVPTTILRALAILLPLSTTDADASAPLVKQYRRLPQILRDGFACSSPSSVAQSLLILERLLESNKARQLQVSDVASIWAIIQETLLPSDERRQAVNTEEGVFPSVLRVVGLVLRSRPDLVIDTSAQLTAVLCAVFPLFQRHRGSRTGLERHAFRRPLWDLSEKAGAQFSRLLVGMVDRPVNLGDGRSSHHIPINLALAKYLPSVLVAYARAVADPMSVIPTTTRNTLEPGLFALCDIITAGGRVSSRGREGEGLGLPFGLGESSGGDAEKEVWAELWRKWSKKRYTGQG